MSNERTAGLATAAYRYSRPSANAGGLLFRARATSFIGGKVEVYSPDNLAIDKLVRNLEAKRQQSSMFMIQGNVSLADMRKISDRIFNKPTCQHMTFIFFEPGTGNMFTFKKP